MLIMAHTGITLGLAYILDLAVTPNFNKRVGRANREPPEQGHAATHASNGAGFSRTSPSLDEARHRVGFHVDYRFILLGALLPDLVDKPIGNFFFREIFNNGRIFSHTLLFLILCVLIATYFLLGKKQYWALFVAFGVLVHLLLDGMWYEPLTFYWPFLGWSFYKYDGMTPGPWVQRMLLDLFTKPVIYVSEISGALIFIFFFIKVIVQKKVRAFIFHGIL